MSKTVQDLNYKSDKIVKQLKSLSSLLDLL